MTGKNGLPPTEPPPQKTKEFLLLLLRRIIEKKKWFLVPLWILLAAIGLILVLTGNIHLLPAIYIAF